MKDFHYFVSHGLGWKTGATLEEAIKGAFCTSWYGDMGKWLKNCQKAGSPGIPFYSCRVPLPADANYEIECFAPTVKGLTECGNKIVTYRTLKTVAWMVDPQDEIRRLNREIKNFEKEKVA